MKKTTLFILFSSMFLLIKYNIINTMDLQNKRKKLCLTCNKYFANFARHNRTHTGEKPYQCYVCEKKFADNTNYRRHVNAHTFPQLINYQSLVELECLFGNNNILNSFKKEFENYEQ